MAFFNPRDSSDHCRRRRSRQVPSPRTRACWEECLVELSLNSRSGYFRVELSHISGKQGAQGVERHAGSPRSRRLHGVERGRRTQNPDTWLHQRLVRNRITCSRSRAGIVARAVASASAEIVCLASPPLRKCRAHCLGFVAMGLSKQLLPCSPSGADRVGCASPAKGHERSTVKSTDEGLGDYIGFVAACIAKMCVCMHACKSVGNLSCELSCLDACCYMISTSVPPGLFLGTRASFTATCKRDRRDF